MFGLGLNLKKLANDHGITFDAIQTGALADLDTLSRPMTPEERAVLQNVIEVMESWRWLSSFDDPHGIYARLPFDLELN